MRGALRIAKLAGMKVDEGCMKTGVSAADRSGFTSSARKIVGTCMLLIMVVSARGSALKFDTLGVSSSVQDEVGLETIDENEVEVEAEDEEVEEESDEDDRTLGVVPRADWLRSRWGGKVGMAAAAARRDADEEAPADRSIRAFSRKRRWASLF